MPKVVKRYVENTIHPNNTSASRVSSKNIMIVLCRLNEDYHFLSIFNK